MIYFFELLSFWLPIKIFHTKNYYQFKLIFLNKIDPGFQNKYMCNN